MQRFQAQVVAVTGGGGGIGGATSKGFAIGGGNVLCTICERSPTALAIAKRSFNMDTAHQAGIAGMGMPALRLYDDTDESREGVAGLKERRKAEFRKFAKQDSWR